MATGIHIDAPGVRTAASNLTTLGADLADAFGRLTTISESLVDVLATPVLVDALRHEWQLQGGAKHMLHGDFNAVAEALSLTADGFVTTDRHAAGAMDLGPVVTSSSAQPVTSHPA